ncbi:MAG TPA: GNAT family N-acetyltransferase [Clostridia bacterium]|nr:GNAT family N-acetyltransferase [Clostridia bacterium]
MGNKICKSNAAECNAFLKCLKVWSDSYNTRKEKWMDFIGDDLNVIMKKEDDNYVGMIQYVPIEYSIAEGKNMYFIHCIWVNGYNEAFGPKQRKGYGTELLQKAIEDVRSRGADAIVAWTYKDDDWLPASWYERQDFELIDTELYYELLWMPFKDAEPPRLFRRKPFPQFEKPTVSLFVNGWCPSCNKLHDIALGIAGEYGDKIDIVEYDTTDREVFLKYGIMDGIFVNDKEIIFLGKPIDDEMRAAIDNLLVK